MKIKQRKRGQKPGCDITRHYDQRPFDETVCDAIITNGGVKEPSKKVQNVCDGGAIKHDSDFSCVCDAGHMVQLN